MSKIDHMSNKIGKCNKYLMPLGLLQRLLANHHQWTCSPHNNIYMEWVMLWVDISGLQSYVCQTDLFLLHSRNPGHCLVLAYPRTLTTTWSTQGHLRNIRSHWNNFWTEFEFRQMHLPHNIEIPQMQSEQQEIQGQSRILFFFFFLSEKWNPQHSKKNCKTLLAVWRGFNNSPRCVHEQIRSDTFF